MKDRFGNSLQMAWPQYQVLWIKAAMTLPIPERQAAFRDIADLTGRLYKDVYGKAFRLSHPSKVSQRRNERRREARRAKAALRAKVEAKAVRKPSVPAPSASPSFIRKFTPQELMTGRVRVSVP